MTISTNEQANRLWLSLAAMNGSSAARHSVGLVELEAENYHRAMRHFLIAAKAGFKDSLDAVKAAFEGGLVTKDEYANTLRAYQKIQDEAKSEMRDKAVVMM